MLRPLSPLLILLFMSLTATAQTDSLNNFLTHMSSLINHHLSKPSSQYRFLTRQEFHGTIDPEKEVILAEEISHIDNTWPLHSIGYRLDADSVIQGVYIKFKPLSALNTRLDSLLGTPSVVSSSNLGEGFETGVWNWNNFLVLKYIDGPYDFGDLVIPKTLTVMIKRRSAPPRP